jgi:hypothetical protein
MGGRPVGRMPRGGGATLGDRGKEEGAALSTLSALLKIR